MGDDAVLREVGPKDVDSAGDMVSRVGVHNQAKRLIKAVRDNYPREMVAALSRPEDPGRSKLLDFDEVERLVEDTGWDDVTEVEGARVYGKGKHAVVGVVFRTESGRSARGVIPYSEFEDSISTYESALAEGGVVVTDEDDPRQLRRALEAAQKKLAEGGDASSGGSSKEEAPEPYPGYADAKVDEVAEKIPALRIDQLVALKTAEEARNDPRDGVLEPLNERLDAAESALEEEDEEAEPYEGYAAANSDDVAEKIPDLSLSQLLALKTAEEDGKARKGVLKPLSERLEAAEAALRGEPAEASEKE